MNKELVNKVKNSFAGYTLFNPIGEVLIDAKRMNELLHVFHSYMLNNEFFYQNLPVLGRFKNNIGEDITIHGKNNNELAKSLFSNFPKELDAGITDIVSLDNKIIMMIRDLGHALTIEIDIENDKCIVRYFVPKICNPLKAKELKGVREIKENEKATSGMFECNKKELLYELYKFISMVPTDNDMFTYGGWFAEKNNVSK